MIYITINIRYSIVKRYGAHMFINKKIKKARIAKNLSLRDLGKISGVSYTTIKNIEDGITKNPGIESVSKVAKSLDISLDELIDDEENYFHGL